MFLIWEVIFSSMQTIALFFLNKLSFFPIFSLYEMDMAQFSDNSGIGDGVKLKEKLSIVFKKKQL